MKRHLQYIKYLIRHKWYVLVAGDQLDMSWWQLIIHDWQKFLPVEWYGYAKTFKSTKTKARSYDENDNDVKVAWNHHQKHCKHHWQYWLLVWDGKPQEALEIPDKYVNEMVADWFGAGRAIRGTWEGARWYKKNKHKMTLHPNTRKKVEKIIDILQKRVKLLP